MQPFNEEEHPEVSFSPDFHLSKYSSDLYRSSLVRNYNPYPLLQSSFTQKSVKAELVFGTQWLSEPPRKPLVLAIRHTQVEPMVAGAPAQKGAGCSYQEPLPAQQRTTPVESSIIMFFTSESYDFDHSVLYAPWNCSEVWGISLAGFPRTLHSEKPPSEGWRQHGDSPPSGGPHNEHQ